MQRRRFLRVYGALAGAATSVGCLGDQGGGDGEDDQGTDDSPDQMGASGIPSIEDPPEAVHIPTHREGMVRGDATEAGEAMVTPMFAVPHEFLIMDASGGERVEPDGDDDLHLMFSVWDPETGVPFPTDSGLVFEIESEDGTLVEPSRAPWPMLSQGMGFHFGDNVSLDGYGTYTVSVSIPPLEDVRRTGDLEGRFETRGEAEFTFEYDEELATELVERIEYLDRSEWGKLGALPPMHGEGHDGDEGSEGHDHDEHVPPYPAVPDADALPGSVLGTPESHDAVIATSLVGAGSRFAEDQYLLVSPRTPYNQGVLPQMELSATVRRDGETVTTLDLIRTLDHKANFHYGATVSDVQPGDEIEVIVETPPLVSRHMGYDTAFREMSPVTVSVLEDR